MRRFLMGFVLCLAALGARADDAMEAVISRQVDAFRAGDFAGAFEFASPTIKRMFRDPENFEAMVRRGYGVMINPADMQFLALREEGGKQWQRVLYRDVYGEVYLFDYDMIEGPDGWLINAVERVRMAQPSV